MPKGLRAFDAEDADFFLQLLPGPRDRDGLPESLRCWKSRIESPDPEQACSMGLLYGPSGCGKSSLVKAGLLPRLAEHSGTPEGQALDDKEDINDISDQDNRVLRGGSLTTIASDVRSASRHATRPSYRPYSVGLRVARTYR